MSTSAVIVKDKPAHIVGSVGGGIRVRYADGTEETVRAGDIRVTAPAPEQQTASDPAPANEAKENPSMEAQASTSTSKGSRKGKPGKAALPKAKPAKKAAKKKAAAKRPAGDGTFQGEVLRERSKLYKDGKVSKICGDDVSTALDGLTPDQKVRVAAKLVEGVSQSQWAGLNGGQKAMNAANRLRGAMTKAGLTITAIRGAVKEVA